MMYLCPLYRGASLEPVKITGAFRFRGSPRLFLLEHGWYGWTLSCKGFDCHTFPTWRDAVSFLEGIA